jgi:amino acid transporter
MTAELRRALGLPALTFYGVGLILGAGIYSILGPAAGVAGEALWQSFVLGSLAAVLTGLSYAELATMFPHAGAEYVYLREAWPRAHWLPGAVGWALIASGTATAATVAIAFSGYAALFFTAFPSWLVAAALLVAAAALNVWGIREASWVNIVFTLIEAAGLVALILVGAQHPAWGQAFLAQPHVGVLAGAGLIFFAFLGFEEIANLAEEAKRPERDVPRAILIAVAASTVLYILVAVSSVALRSPERLAASSSALADAMRAGAPRLAGALGGVALFATANTALIAMTAASRMLLGMARGGDAPGALRRTLPERKTPALAIGLVTVGTLAFLPLGGVALVGSVASLMALVAFASVNVALIRLRYRAPGRKRPFRVPGSIGKFPIFGGLGLLVTLILLAQLEGKAYGLGIAALCLALLGQAFARRQRRGS